jgi:hypothetical protein
VFQVLPFRDQDHGKTFSKKTMSIPRHALHQRTAMTNLASVKNEELNCDKLDQVSGGIIIVGGIQRLFTSALERVALNPQPLPPQGISFRS